MLSRGCGASFNYPFLTSKERDNETGLDYFGARYYGSTQGRFTTPDPLLSSGRVESPQSWNRYSYVLNNPLALIDPDGLYDFDASVSEEQRKKFNAGLAQAKANLQKIAKTFGTDSTEYKKAQRALNAYGTLGDKNGVTILAKEGSGGGQTTAVKGTITKENPTGQNINVSFHSNQFDSEEFSTDIGHEGSHVADGSDWATSGFDRSKLASAYQSEFDAYTVQSVLAEALHPDRGAYYSFDRFQEPGKNAYLEVRRLYLYDPSWRGVDIATVRAVRGANIDRWLERPKKAGGKYELTPSSKEQAF